MTLATLSRHKWTSADYERMISAGMFEKIELFWGDVVITGAYVRPYRWALEDYEQLIALESSRANTWNSSRERFSPWR
jgi:hypothetical protein